MIEQLSDGTTNLNNAIRGVKLLVNDRFQDVDSLTVDDLSGLNGLLEALMIVSNQNKMLMDAFEMEVANK